MSDVVELAEVPELFERWLAGRPLADRSRREYARNVRAYCDWLSDTPDRDGLHTPGHAPGHLSLWQPDERLLIVGDALSDYDVGWVNRALDGPDAAATALASLQRLANLAPRVLLPSHGPILTDPDAAFGTALRRAQRLVDDPEGNRVARRAAHLRVRADDPRRDPQR
jgi:glyoxylase-like metal-dependent hydrolase (beta-lactamase superfamily II)